MDAYTILLDNETEMCCTLLLFKDVENSDEIRRKVMNGELTCSVVKAALVADPLQAIVAANKAAVNAKVNQLTTKSIYTEVLFNLSISKNISRALKEFGINDNDKNILIVLIHEKNEKLMEKMIVDSIKGERVSISKLSEFTDYELIKKVYKIEKDELNVSSLTNSVVSRISCKDFISVK
ncbi:EKC/KEOPS complex subunit TPRKB-like [Ceratina calcarata]|uniref:EKC/KEOPS complex subunit TPRKB-like n=1 Tax=Ceratina calcarata TaxID=156304 RepID=A0AAJ7N5T1_9HYME|nr:EKC/KEOPS complex subunit TPRKB-like [Ceratina calcarata]XP_017878960.1 EKC/KEOPS complex subunit TPRKB-like [Ceratina calcarata]XP_026668847.1 EKC/KEOPS complex subunit TPRKB-like [Ceratina calcarata]